MRQPRRSPTRLQAAASLLYNAKICIFGSTALGEVGCVKWDVRISVLVALRVLLCFSFCVLLQACRMCVKHREPSHVGRPKHYYRPLNRQNGGIISPRCSQAFQLTAGCRSVGRAGTLTLLEDTFPRTKAMQRKNKLQQHISICCSYCGNVQATCSRHNTNTAHGCSSTGFLTSAIKSPTKQQWVLAIT